MATTFGGTSGDASEALGPHLASYTCVASSALVLNVGTLAVKSRAKHQT